MLFQFTPLREGRPAGIFDATRRPYFNSRPSARGDIAALVAFRHVEDFNSRPSARGDREFVHGAARVGISIHAPPRGATSQKNAKKGFTRFQFTPLREGRRAPVWYHIIRSNISIHAPPRGATCAILVSSAGSISIHAPPRGATRACWLAADGADISIHAPPRGATEQNRRESGRRSYFNSRPSARGDLIDKYKTIDYTNFNSRPSARGDRYRAASYSARKISIHAPPRGATKENLLTMALEIISIHAPPRGATVWLDEEPLDWPFQFTPLREGRRQPGGKRRNTHDFNSRPSARGDKSPGRTPGGSHISIHAPPRGATHPRETFPASRLFQFTPLREGRRQRNHKVSERFNFNSRPSARGDLLWLSDNVSPANFNSRPSARGDEA